jgi:hypothetical protein
MFFQVQRIFSNEVTMDNELARQRAFGVALADALWDKLTDDALERQFGSLEQIGMNAPPNPALDRAIDDAQWLRYVAFVATCDFVPFEPAGWDEALVTEWSDN